MLSVKVGVFSTRGSNGSQSVTGVGFQPEVVLFFGFKVNTTGVVDTHARRMTGWMEENGGQAVTSGIDVDNQGTSDANSAHHRDGCIHFTGGGGATEEKASFTSMDADGFTINWGTGNTVSRMAYIAIAGLTAVKAAAGPTIATSGTPQSQTGVGFEPDVIGLMHANSLAPNSNQADNMWGVGFGADDLSEMCQFMWSDDANLAMQIATAVRSSVIGSWQRTGGANAIHDFNAEMSSMDADGFSLAVSDLPSTTIPTSYLALAGCKAHCGTFSKRTSTGTQSVTGVGFEPRLVIFLYQWQTGGANHGTIGMGAADDAGNEMAGSTYQADGANTGNTNLSWHEDKAISIEAAGVMTGAADLTSMDADGFTLDWTTADGAASLIGYLAIGDPPAPASFVPKVMALA